MNLKMRKLLLLLIIIVAGFLGYKYFFKKDAPRREEPKPLAVSKHSAVFNQSLNAILADYYAMTDGFVKWDSVIVNKNAKNLEASLHNLKVEELKKDTTIYQTVIFPWDNCKLATSSIPSTPEWEGKRRALQDISENLRILLITVKYDQGVAYWQECPMAFGEGMSANWLSAKKEIINPYLGSKDPQYGNSMLNCGETKATIDFTAPDTIKVN